MHLGKKCPSKIITEISSYKLWFLRGLDQRRLDLQQRLQFLKFVKQDPQGHSFLVYNSAEVQRKHQDWTTTLPWIKPFYAIKSNPINPLLTDLVNRGAGLDCASKAEIKKALSVGAKPDEIVYSNPIKEPKDINYAKNQKVLLTTADTLDELKKIAKVAPEMKVLWRISIKEENSERLATVFSNKFGDDITSIEDAEKRFKQIRSMGIRLEGIHFHCGSGQHGSSSFRKAVNIARACMEIGREQGHRMETLDLGGG
jgi:diaminopimelate decarboxylase